MNYKDTLNLPVTNFPMKASLSLREPLQQKKWDEVDIYSKIQQSRKDDALFCLHDGPPYANGHIHMGHALNKILKDFVVKYKTMRGFKAPFVPGWDCHGLPIEHQLLKTENQEAAKTNQVAFRKKAHDFALKWVNTQKEEFKRLGVFADWDNPYLTLNPKYEAAILETLKDIHKMGAMYKAKKPVYWSIGCETALAEAEVEYADHSSPSVYVAFQIKDKPNNFFVIWTTTPWTLPANLAIAVHENFIYNEIICGSKTFIVAKELNNSFISSCSLKDVSFGKDFNGSELEGISYIHPFIERESKVILSPFVTLETGTGLVHTAPGHGQEDYIAGLKYNLPVLSPVDEKGRFTKEAKVFEGMLVFEANKHIIDLLKEKNALLHTENINHSYPHCWRSKQPIIFRATEQWFISMDKTSLRDKSLDNIKSVKWVPSFGETRIRGMVETRPDWCISRQRLWGVPIPALKCKECGNSFFDYDFIDDFIKKVEINGVNVWFEKEVHDISNKDVKCPHCKSNNFVKEQDIVDVWFESGVSYLALAKEDKNFKFPTDLYLEGSDQHRGWFQSSLMTASALNKNAPFATVLTHGFVVDGEGKKMSKSLGNVVDPQDIVKRYGADILRLWVASSDYSMDIKLSENHFNQISDTYRKVRNTFRFLLGNLNDFSKDKALKLNELLDLDKWILIKFKELHLSMEKDMDDFKFYRAWSSAYNFCNIELSSVYFSIQKDILYCASPISKLRLSAQTAMSIILEELSKILFPFISFTSEEVWAEIPFKKVDESIALQKWNGFASFENEDEILYKYKKLSILREEIFKKLENLITEKTISSGLQAVIKLKFSNDDDFNYYCKIKEELKRYLIVSSVIIEKDSCDDIIAFKNEGVKCPRCWIVFNPDESGKIKELCCSCNEAVENFSS